MPESIQHKLDRVRPPRVQITYDVQIGDAFEVKELPFVVGVMADLSGDNTEKPKWADRRFVEIDRDSFKDVFAQTKPAVQLSVSDKIHLDKSMPLPVHIGAEPQAPLDVNNNPLDALLDKLRREDPLYMFNPVWIIGQSPELRALFEARGRLTDLLAKLDGNRELRDELATAAKAIPDDLKLPAGQYPQGNGNGAAKQISTSAEPPKIEASTADAPAADPKGDKKK